MSDPLRRISLQTKLIYHVRKNAAMYKFAACIALAGVGVKFFGLSWLMSAAGVTSLYVATGGWRGVRLFYLTFGRDLWYLGTFLKIERTVQKYVANKHTIATLFDETAEKYPEKIAFQSVDTGKKLTFRQAKELSNRIANAFLEKGYQKGETVGMLMENCVEYVPIWLGLSKIGVVTSLLNYNLKGESLKHCIVSADCKAVIYSTEMEENLSEIALGLGIDFYYFGNESSSIQNNKHLNVILQSSNDTPPIITMELSITDKMLYIYTSGTTGLPKAAVIRGSRYLYMTFGLSQFIQVTNDDTMYNTMPLYHTNGGIVLAGTTIIRGTTLVMRKKFSASRFFEDCHNFDVTAFNYIGETCRYLLASKPSKFDQDHRVRFAFGNGLRGSIWSQFTSRFNIPNIGEFYGATESNASMINVDNVVGAVGVNSVIAPWFYPISLVRIDKETREIIRGADGFAIKAQAGELGELCGKIKKNNVLRQFDGYKNTESTKKKIVKNLFKKGDSYFMTGDVLIQDELGYYYFQDRLGDTFRWKGENVSTNEVEGIISRLLKLNDVCVYGVDVSGTDGKAGMAVIADPQRKVDVDALAVSLASSLPVYARPLFIRLTDEIEKTSTYKFRKTTLREQNYDPVKCPKADTLFYFDSKIKRYLPLDADVHAKIVGCQIRF